MPKDMNKRVGFYTSSNSWRNVLHWQFTNAKVLAGKGWDVTVFITGKNRLYKRLKSQGVKTVVFKKTGLLIPDMLRFSALLRKHEITSLFINSSKDISLAGLAGHLCDLKKIIFRRGTVTKIRFNLFNRIAFKKGYITHIITNTEAHKTNIENKRSACIRNTNFKVIYNGMELRSLEVDPGLVQKYRKNGETIVGIADARGAEEKLIKFLRYFKSSHTSEHDLRFFIYKRSSSDHDIEREVNKLGLNGSVVWSVQEKGIDRFLDSIDVFLSFQARNEFNYPVLYAMAHFKPVIALANGSNTEIIQSNENGFLYSEEDLNSAFHKLKILSDKNYREKIGKNARETVEKKFNFDTSIEKIESVIE